MIRELRDRSLETSSCSYRKRQEREAFFKRFLAVRFSLLLFAPIYCLLFDFCSLTSEEHF